MKRIEKAKRYEIKRRKKMRTSSTIRSTTMTSTPKRREKAVTCDSVVKARIVACARFGRDLGAISARSRRAISARYLHRDHDLEADIQPASHAVVVAARVDGERRAFEDDAADEERHRDAPEILPRGDADEGAAEPRHARVRLDDVEEATTLRRIIAEAITRRISWPSSGGRRVGITWNAR